MALHESILLFSNFYNIFPQILVEMSLATIPFLSHTRDTAVVVARGCARMIPEPLVTPALHGQYHFSLNAWFWQNVKRLCLGSKLLLGSTLI